MNFIRLPFKRARMAYSRWFLERGMWPELAIAELMVTETDLKWHKKCTQMLPQISVASADILYFRYSNSLFTLPAIAIKRSIFVHHSGRKSCGHFLLIPKDFTHCELGRNVHRRVEGSDGAIEIHPWPAIPTISGHDLRTPWVE